MNTNTSFTEMIMTQRVARPPRRRTNPWATRGGLFDLFLVACVVLVVAGRTPAGALMRWGTELTTNENARFPELTHYFSAESSVVVPSDFEDMGELPPEPSPPEPNDPEAVPEPYRSAVRASLAGGLPPELKRQLLDEGRKPTPDQALALLDTMWAEHNDPEVVLEIATLGADLRERAIARAIAAGEWDPERYKGHRRYLASQLTREADRFVAGTMALATALDLAWPVKRPYRVSSGFGYRMHPILKKKRFHNGIDFPLEVGTPLHAAQGGRVEMMGNSRSSGMYVVLDHGAGVRTSYSHMSEHHVKWGQEVEKGDVIGLSGNSGMSTGPHLHYTVRVGTRSVDPMRFEPEEE